MNRTTNPWGESLHQKPEKTESLLLTFEDAARLLQVCKRTVERLVGRGELPVIRVGRAPRISRKALMQWLEGGGVVAATEMEAKNG